MSFEIQDLNDIIRLIIFISFDLNKKSIPIKNISNRLKKLTENKYYIDEKDINLALKDMINEELIILKGESIHFTERGISLGQKWQDFFWKTNPIMEFIAGLTDGSITSLVIIISAFMGKLNLHITLFSAMLTLFAVMITNFSSFFLGGLTEELSDLENINDLMNYSLGDNPDKKQRDKSLKLLRDLNLLFRVEIKKNNIFSAIVCGFTTFVAGIVPIILYYTLIKPWDFIISIIFIIFIILFFLVYYRAKISKTRIEVTLLETILIITIAVVGSLILGQTS